MGRIALWTLGLLAASAIASIPIGCGATSGNNALEDDDDATGLGGSGAGTTAAGAPTGLDFDAGNDDGSLSDGEVCEGVEQSAKPLPLHMILVIDRSGSMNTYGYWSPLQQALIQFIQDPLSEGLYVGLNYFPAPGGGDSCSLGLWNPVQVPNGAPPLALLPQDANALITSINGTSTGNMTPMYGGLAGSYQVAHDLQTVYPNDKVIVVLASDGLPTECGGSYEDINWLATNVVASEFATHGIETYAIAIAPGVVSAMSTIAQAGGTLQSYDVSQDTSAFAQKMSEIRGSAIGCEYLIPDSGTEFDPYKVNVSITIDGGTPQSVPQADDETDCGSGDGWYYDDAANPTMIILCPTTCQTIETAQENQQQVDVDVKFGCPTEVN